MPAQDSPLELLLSDADARTPVLEHGLPSATLTATTPPREPKNASDLWLEAVDRDPNLLDLQRWGIIVPDGPEGERLLGAVAALRRHRRDEMGREPAVFKAPPGLDLAAAVQWRDKFIRPESLDASDRSRYLMILGDLTQVSLELQHVLAHGAFVGRLTLPGEADYGAYADKVIKWEKAELESPRLLTYSVQDGTAATSAGYRHLVQPCTEKAERNRLGGELALSETVTIRYDEEGPDDLLAAAAANEGDVLLSLSHGLGAPRDGWKSAELQRRRQGALCLGLDSEPLTAESIAARPFLPGGVWMMVSCFGAGTPSTSAYQPWLAALASGGVQSSAIADVLRSLPGASDPPFIAALPQAALANPNGPLAVLGHIDLAWTFAFLDEGRVNRASRIYDALRTLLVGSRAGIALDTIMAAYRDTNDRLTGAYQARQEARLRGGEPPDDQAIANLWMRRNDLRGYVLLGDPAVHLPLTRARARLGDPLPASIIMQSRPGVPTLTILPPQSPVPKDTRSDKPRASITQTIVPPDGPAAVPSTRPVPPDSQPHASLSRPAPEPAPRDAPGPDPARRRERAVLALLRGELTAKAVATEHGVDLDDLLDWLERYRLAGRRELARDD